MGSINREETKQGSRNKRGRKMGGESQRGADKLWKKGWQYKGEDSKKKRTVK